jgi:hypothetical protein
MDNFASATSQHVLSRASIDSARISASLTPAIESHAPTLTAVWKMYAAEPVQLLRSREGRLLSRARVRRSEEFMPSLELSNSRPRADFLYSVGIVAQLALSSHLLDVGFPDTWCACHIGHHIDKSLAYANATGFGYVCADTAQLAQVLSPYWKWNRRSLLDNPQLDNDGFTAEDILSWLQALIDHVYRVTGHSRPHSRVSKA